MTRKTTFLSGGLGHNKSYDLGLALDMVLKYCTSVAKRLKLKVRKFWGLIPTLVEVTREKLVGGGVSPILNRVKINCQIPSKDYEGNNFCKIAGSRLNFHNILVSISLMYLFCLFATSPPLLHGALDEKPLRSKERDSGTGAFL